MIAALTVCTALLGSVTAVVDGDTVLVDGRTVDLLGVDCPPDFLRESKKWLTLYALDRDVQVVDENNDWGRVSARLLWRDLDIGQQLVRLGVCRATSDRYAADEEFARQQRRGMWKTPPVALLEPPEAICVGNT